MLRSNSSCSSDVLTAARNLAAALNNSTDEPVAALEPDVVQSISKWINNQVFYLNFYNLYERQQH